MATDRLIGHDLARYHVEAVLGRGGMGVVYRATDMRLGRTVALKVLSDERSADPDFRERFLRESRLLASIDHPNIVPIYEADEADGRLYIAMRYVPGPELRLIIADEAPMDAAKTVAIIGQVADALDAAHAAGLVHRDVKPGNILVMAGATSELAGHAYLTDFGLTKATGSDTGLTKIGQFVGTPGYVAPEQIEGRGVDHRVDVYALGCILYNCLSGDVPYPRDSTVASLWAHLKEPPPRLSEHRKGLPKGLDAVITRALAKSPDERFQTCGALAQAARAAIEPARRKRAVAGAAVAGAAAAAAGADAGAAAETAIDPTPVLAAPTMAEAAVATPDVAEPDMAAAAVVAASTVVESSPDVGSTAAADATVVEGSIAPDPAVDAVPARVEETVVESKDAMPLAAATIIDSRAGDAPVGAAATSADAGGPAADAPPDPDDRTAAVTVVSGATVASGTGRRTGSGALAGRERPFAAVLAAVVLVGGGLLAFNVIGGRGADGPSQSPTSSSAVVPSIDPGVYVAQAGDTIGSIAGKLGVTLDQLRAANPGISEVVAVGQWILIPDAESTSQPSSTTTTTPSASSSPSMPPSPSPSATPPPPDPPPTGKADLAGSQSTYTRTARVAVNVHDVSDDATEMAFSTSSSSPTSWQSIKDFTVPLSKEGTYKVYVRFRDAAGHVSSTSVTDTVTYDVTPPSGSISVSGTKSVNGKSVVYNDDVTIKLKASDANGVRYRLAQSTDGLSGTTKKYDESVPFKLGGTKSEKVYVRFTDLAGNHVDKSVTVYYDRKPVAANNTYYMTPGCSNYLSVLGNDSDPDGDDLTVTSVSVGDSSEGHAEVRAGNKAINYYSEVPWEHDQTLTYTIKDEYGSTDSASVTIHLTNPPPCL